MSSSVKHYKINIILSQHQVATKTLHIQWPNTVLGTVETRHSSI